MYDIEVEGNHNYFANGVLVHNCHRSLSNTHQEIARAFPHAKHLGITATPRRGDQKDLMKFFEAKAADVPLSELIEKGILSPLTIKNIPVKIALEASRKSGDYTEQDCAHAIEPYLDSIADHYALEARGKCGLVFAPLISTSKRFTEILKSKGVRAEHVDGEMGPERVNAAVDRLKRGDVECLCNSMILTEGIDIRPVNILLSLRPTRSWTLYVQTIGRATRTFDPDLNGPEGTIWPRKDGALILDPLWLCEQHSLLQRPSTLLASDDEEAEAIDNAIKKAIAGGGKADILQAREDARAEREARLAEKLAALAHRKARMVNAMDFMLLSNLPEWAEYEGLNDTENRPISCLTEKQMSWITKSKFDLESIRNYAQAKKILDVLGERAKQGLCTMAQCKYLEGLGYESSTGRRAFDATFDEATKFIEANAKPQPWRKWKRN